MKNITERMGVSRYPNLEKKLNKIFPKNHKYLPKFGKVVWRKIMKEMFTKKANNIFILRYVSEGGGFIVRKDAEGITKAIIDTDQEIVDIFHIKGLPSANYHVMRIYESYGIDLSDSDYGMDGVLLPKKYDSIAREIKSYFDNNYAPIVYAHVSFEMGDLVVTRSDYDTVMVFDGSSGLGLWKGKYNNNKNIKPSGVLGIFSRLLKPKNENKRTTIMKSNKKNIWEVFDDSVLDITKGMHTTSIENFVTKAKNNNLGYNRDYLPQINDIPATVKHMMFKWDAKKSRMKIKNLKASQQEFNVEKVKGMVHDETYDPFDRVYFIDHEDRLMDGHHSWIYGNVVDPEQMVDVIRIPLPFKNIRNIMNRLKNTSNQTVDEAIAEYGEIAERQARLMGYNSVALLPKALIENLNSMLDIIDGYEVFAEGTKKEYQAFLDKKLKTPKYKGYGSVGKIPKDLIDDFWNEVEDEYTDEEPEKKGKNEAKDIDAKQAITKMYKKIHGDNYKQEKVDDMIAGIKKDNPDIDDAAIIAIAKKSMNKKSVKEAAPNKEAKRILKGMQKIKMSPWIAKAYLLKYLYYDKDTKQFWAVSWEGYAFEVNNIETLKDINKYVNSNNLLNEGTQKEYQAFLDKKLKTPKYKEYGSVGKIPKDLIDDFWNEVEDEYTDEEPESKKKVK